jgi:hypothetical protein
VDTSLTSEAIFTASPPRAVSSIAASARRLKGWTWR